MNTSNQDNSVPDIVAEYYLQLAEDEKSIDVLWHQMIKGDWRHELLEDLRKRFHKLVGESVNVGLSDISTSARALNSALKTFIEQGEKYVPSKEKYIELEGLYDAFQKAVSEKRRSGVFEDEAHIAATHTMGELRSNRLIYLVEDDKEQAAELSSQIGYYGYTVEVFAEFSGVKKAIDKAIPRALLMDVEFPEEDIDGIDLVNQLQPVLEGNVPVIFVSANEDLDTRLRAVRAGGVAYFSKPANIGNLIDVLDRYFVRVAAEPFRILIVDDSRIVTHRASAILGKAGMLTQAINDPLQVMEPLFEFTPDLILLDVNMPGCSGTELAAVIRQMETFVSVPIVFLSSEKDQEIQIEAMTEGGDEFLNKDIKPQYLIDLVEARVNRYRKLRSLMMRDSLTGLLNHTSLEDRLNQEINRAKRSQLPLSVAMIDLDRFKSVNDTYGHAAGDRVLKNLSRMLTQRLRRSDIIGRYGGEEFAVILPETSAKDCLWLMDEMRETFSSLYHQAGEEQFIVTFSCGVASFPYFDNAAAISKAADDALYEAKRQGRNRVVIAER